MKQRIPSSIGSAPAFGRLVFSTSIFLLLLTLSYPGQAAEPGSLRSAVANILERNGFTTNTADGRESDVSRSSSPASVASAAAVSTGNPMEVPADEPGTSRRDERVVEGLIIVFADEEAKSLSRDNFPPPLELIEEVEDVAGVALQFERAMSLGGFVFAFEEPLSWRAFEPVLQSLKQLDSIERVAADTSASANIRPNDTYIHTQWSLYSSGWLSRELDNARVTGIGAYGAWDITTGSNETVIAVLDTGLVQSAPFASWRILPGYDFISEPDNSRDGDGRDNDPADVGDRRLQDECEDFPEARDSSWHGTAVASVLAEAGNDDAGIAGINWRAGILPVRVLGKCGGLNSDIVDGLLWAAGFPVPGVPDNTNPADIINMSLGNDYEFGCEDTPYAWVINDVIAKGVLVVTSAGNDNSEAKWTIPGGCEGVITVGATDHLGNRTSYSNWSRENAISISAPGGDAERHNTGAAMLVAAGDDGRNRPRDLVYQYRQGTSFAAPLVTGVASLALGLDPEQHPQVIASVMALTAQPFAEGSDCELEFPLCGQGIVDALATLEAVEVLKSYKVVGEFYHEGINHYFRTGNWDEIDLVLKGQFGAWKPTSDLFLSWRDGADGALPVCRFYGTPGIGPNSHFYTVDPEECEKVKRDVGWTYEGVPFYAKMHDNGSCPADTMPVYRYYNQRASQNDANHRFATHLDDQDAMEAEGWVLEGVAMCAPG